jgi:hypothetical protein
LNNTGTDYLHGNPVTEPVVFGTPVTIPHDFGNDVTLPKNFGNAVTWQPNPAHFGNIFGATGIMLRTQIDITPAQLATIFDTPVQVIPAPGLGFRINVMNVVFQPGSGTGQCDGAYYLGTPSSLADGNPEFNVNPNPGFIISESFNTLFMSSTAETEGDDNASIPVSYVNNAPYMLQLSEDSSVTWPLRVILYYTIEPVY